ncbi:Sialate O-acetylesterase [uncultured Defluviicoccus sp.]|uniref:Sialate O-acetylesterase n=1 Tax=metagenome TaxID=256318 RepID=A0A380TFQ2_9ZZZZ|nr:Sialate O-acetylesterase [uncultured Defluviicoccus sp.]
MWTPRSTLCVLLSILLPIGLLRADVTLAPLFTDHAVLQREQPVPVWGAASAGERVVVTFAGQTAETVADPTGHWRVTLQPMPASAESRNLVARGTNAVTITDVLVGEVWLASGQSNMERPIDKTFDAAIDIPGSTRYPLIRHFKVAHQVAETPTVTGGGQWQLPGSETTGQFTAVGYYFARDLLDLLHVPIGIINSTWGGTPVESWTDPVTAHDNPAFAAVHQRWQKTLADYPHAKAAYDAELRAWQEQKAAAGNRPFSKPAPRAPAGPGHQFTPSGLYNGMIAPLIPYALRGAIWYQGEANAGRAGEYQALFSALITGWRRDFAQGDFPFYWVQLANFRAGAPERTPWASLREAQTQTLALPNTGQAVIIDLGDANDVHPRDKRDVGRRLARLALHRTYGMKLVDSGPVMAAVTREGPVYRVEFKNIADGLINPRNTLTGFELAGADRVFHAAEARLADNTVLVSSRDVPDPVAVRYAWRNSPDAGLFNSEGLPAVPFRTDDW